MGGGVVLLQTRLESSGWSILHVRMARMTRITRLTSGHRDGANSGDPSKQQAGTDQESICCSRCCPQDNVAGAVANFPMTLNVRERRVWFRLALWPDSPDHGDEQRHVEEAEGLCFSPSANSKQLRTTNQSIRRPSGIIETSTGKYGS